MQQKDGMPLRQSPKVSSSASIVPTTIEPDLGRSPGLSISISGAEMLVVDPQGRRTGFDSRRSNIVQEIPDSIYEDPEVIPPGGKPNAVLSRAMIITQNAEGPYRMVVIPVPTGVGNSEATAYRFDVFVTWHGTKFDQTTTAEISDDISKDEILEYQLWYSPQDGKILIEPSL